MMKKIAKNRRCTNRTLCIIRAIKIKELKYVAYDRGTGSGGGGGDIHSFILWCLPTGP